MRDFFTGLFESNFVPHGQAYLMRPEIIWVHVISDALIALAYFSILIALAYFLRKRSDLGHRGMFVLFGFFVFACGVVHLMEIWSVWHGTFRLVGLIKAVTGVASVAMAIMLVKVVPQALALPAPDELDQARLALQGEITERERARSSWSAAHDDLKRQIDEQATELRGAKQGLAAERAAVTRLHELGLRLMAPRELQPLLEEVMTGTIALQNADFGTLQLSNPGTQSMEVVAHRGFPKDAPDDFKRISESSVPWGDALRAGECVLIEDVLTDRGFEPHWAIAASAGFRSVQFTPLIDRTGGLMGIVSTHFRQPHPPVERDMRLTGLYARQAAEMIERKRAETAMTENDRRFRQLIRGLNDYAIFMLDPAGRLVTWNVGAECIVGFDAQEALGKHFSLLYEPGDTERPGEAMRLTVAEGRFEDETLRIRKDGSQYWSHMVLTPLKDDAGALLGFAGVIRDVTERKQAEDELRRNEAYLSEAQKLSQTGSWGWDVPAGSVFWSEETFRIFGVNPRDVKPSYQLFLQVVHPEDRATVEQAFEKAERESQKVKIEFRIVLPDGSTKHVRSISHPVSKELGLAGFAGAVVDVTQQKLAEEAFDNARAELARVTRLTIEQHAASIGNEIGKSLEAIASNGAFCFRLAEATRALPYEAREPLLNIVKDANRASEVIERVRENTRRSSRDRVLLQAGDLVLDVLELASRDLKQNGISVQTEFAENLPKFLGNRIELQQALINLIANAIEAMNSESHERRVLTIRTAQDTLDGKKAVLIAVQDCGIGFDPEQKDRMFDAFYSTKANGMGMGLPISRGMVEAHGGRLAASANVGRGATFTCILPAAD